MEAVIRSESQNRARDEWEEAASVLDFLGS
jgi:hypothetical protein